MRVFLGFSEVHQTFHQVVTIITYVKHVSFKNFIFGRYKLIKKPLRIHTKSLSDALAPSKKKFACGAGLWQLCRAFRIAGVPIVHQIFARNWLSLDL